MINKKTILITGGTGSFGQKFVSTAIVQVQTKKNYNFQPWRAHAI